MRISDWSSDVCSSDLIADDDVARPRREAVERAKSDVAGTAGGIQQLQAGPRVQPVDHGRLPQPVHAAGHAIVHQVIAPGDGLKDSPYQRRLLRLADLAVADMGDRKSTRLNSSH